jgi:hypothetical protein
MHQTNDPVHLMQHKIQNTIQLLRSVSSAMLKYAEGEAGWEGRKTDENDDDGEDEWGKRKFQKEEKGMTKVICDWIRV